MKDERRKAKVHAIGKAKGERRKCPGNTIRELERCGLKGFLVKVKGERRKAKVTAILPGWRKSERRKHDFERQFKERNGGVHYVAETFFISSQIPVGELGKIRIEEISGKR